MAISPSSLVRNTNTCWSYFPSHVNQIQDVQEVRLEVQEPMLGSQRYSLISSAVKILKTMQSVFQPKESATLSQENKVSPPSSSKWSFVAKKMTPHLFSKQHHQEPPDALCSKTFQNGIDIPESETRQAHLPGHWRIIASHVNTTAHSRMLQRISFFHRLSSHKIVTLTIEKVPEPWLKRIFHKVVRTAHLCSTSQEKCPPLASNIQTFFSLHPDIASLLARRSYSDPFTVLAAQSAQTTEQHYVMETETKSSFQFVLRDERLYLEESGSNEVEDSTSIPFTALPITPAPSADLIVSHESTEDPVSFRLYAVDATRKQENREVVQHFIRHLTQEYGFWLIDFLKSTYNIDLIKMQRTGEKLTPAHVLKANIGANNIEMGHFFALLANLKRLANRLERHPERSETHFLDFLQLTLCGIKDYLSLRELRNLLLQIDPDISHHTQITCQQVQEHIKHLFFRDDLSTPNQTNPSALQPEAFNLLVDLLVPKDEELHRIFTGREITHLPIFGFNTMGSTSIPNKSRDMFELLHIFPALKRPEWDNFFELLGHVVAKKTLYRPNSDDEGFHVGLLIPGPTLKGMRTWYYNDTFIDDSNGNFSYTLRPACDQYRTPDLANPGHMRPLPYIKLYRSTASDTSNPNSRDSKAADLNPQGPGSLKPELAYHYEHENFEKRTIPTWLGYVILGKRFEDTRPASYGAWMTTAVTQFKEYRLRNRLEAKVPRSEVTAMETFLHKTQYRELVELLIEKADELGEHPRTKKGQDLAFVGHSLGGALAQAGLHTFCVRTSRIPLPGYHIICSTSHAPATKNETNAQFMRMMEENDEMLSLNGIHFYISHQFEKGDFVPQSGGSHLGSVVYKSKPPLLPFASTIRHERLTCLSFHAHVFSPLATAQVKEIVSAPTHGRRIGSGTEQDYQLTELNSQEVHDFDHALKLRGKLAKVFQYSILSCPKVTEWVRKNLGGRVILPVYSLYNRLTGPGEGEREADDVLYMRFSSNRALCQLTTGMGRPRRAARTEQALAPAASM